MSQVASGSAAASPTASQGAPGQPAPQPQQIDPSEFARLQSENQALQRESAKVKGFQPFYEKAKAYGFDKPEAFDQYGPAIKTMRDRGIDPANFAKAFEQVKNEDPDQSAALTIKDVERLVGEKMSEAQKKWIREQATKERDGVLSSELDSLSEAQVAKLLGDDVPDPFKKVAYFAALGQHISSRTPYAEDHPLAGELGPVGKDGMETISKFLKESYGNIRTAMEAASAAKIGAAARKPAPSTAGSAAGQGAPTNNNKRPGGLPSKADIEQAYKDRQAARAR